LKHRHTGLCHSDGLNHWHLTALGALDHWYGAAQSRAALQPSAGGTSAAATDFQGCGMRGTDGPSGCGSELPHPYGRTVLVAMDVGVTPGDDLLVRHARRLPIRLPPRDAVHYRDSMIKESSPSPRISAYG
jgi:hypothetical protein